MKKQLVSLFLLVTAVLASCVEKSPEPGGELRGSFIKRTECNPARNKIETGKDQECISYYYEKGTLYLTHINAGFNCCPGDFGVVKLSTDGSAIILDETKVTGDCHCLCLYDVDYKIENISPAKYNFKAIGNVSIGNGKPLSGSIDLLNEKSGTFCVTRESYPWNM